MDVTPKTTEQNVRTGGKSEAEATNNNNNNNNTNANVYGAIVMAEPLREFIRFI